MKSFRLNSIITSIRSKTDHSLGLTMSTPELSPEQRADIMEIQGINLDMYLKPLDTEPTGLVTIDKDLSNKSQSERIRNVLFLLWQQNTEGEDFNIYYRRKTEKYIEFLKAKLN